MNYLKNKIFDKQSKEKIAIIIQGSSIYVPEVKNAWKDFKNDLIFSTWKGCENEYNKNDIVIFNNEPNTPGPFNFNYQKISTYNGILKAKEMGYTHVLKIRSDCLPTNSIELIKSFELDKLNFMMWHYTSFLWLTYPTLPGYFDDHVVFGPIDYMLELWNIPNNFCYSPEIMLTWSYISKLNHININYFLHNLNNNNDIFYIKFNNIDNNNSFAHNIINKNFGDRELFGRYESIFKNNSEYNRSPEETQKFFFNNYLNFLKYYNPLPKITLYKNPDKNIKNMLIGHFWNKDIIIYPKNKLSIETDINNITGEYVISSEHIHTSADLIIEYFKKKDIMYSSTITSSSNPGNIGECNLYTKDEFKKQLNIND